MQPEVLTAATRTGAQAAAIEADLAELFQAALTDEERRSGAAVMQAQVSNLLVYSPSDGLDAVRGALLHAALQQPSHAVVIASGPDVEAPLTSEVSAICRRESGSADRVCCELITVQTGRSSLIAASNAALPLLLPDLPVVLWWRAPVPACKAPGSILAADAPEAVTFQTLAASAGRIIVDSQGSSSADNLNAEVLAHVSGWIQRLPKARLTDVAWARLQPWRELIAVCFEGERQGFLEQIDHVALQGGPALRSRVAARLVAGWLQAALAPQPLSSAYEVAQAAEDLSQIALTGRDGLAVTLIRDGNSLRGAARFAGTAPFQSEMAAPSRDVPELLLQELRIQRRDRVYEAAVAHACALPL